MKSDDELLEIIRMHLAEGCDELWDELTPEERRRVFPKLIAEFVETTY